MVEDATSQPTWLARTFAGRMRIEPLTGIRWFACLIVFFHHNTPGGQTPMWLVYFMNNGSVGVTIFFVLSGFVLAITYAASFRAPQARTTWEYAVARIARIYPLYILLLIAALLLSLAEGNKVGRLDFGLQVTMLQAWSPDFGAAYGVNPPGWTLSVEMFLYLCFPLLVIILRPGRLATRWAVVVIGAIVLAMVAMVWAMQATGAVSIPAYQAWSTNHWYRLPVIRLGDFTLGIAAAAIYLNLRTRADVRRVAWAGPLAVLSGLLIVGLLFVPHLGGTTWGGDLAFAVPTVGLVLGLSLATHSRLGRFMSLPVIVLLGELSFPFYLAHLVVQNYVTGFPLTDGFTPMSTVQFIGIFLLILALSYVLWRWYAQPARGWVRQVLAGRRGPRRVDHAAGAATP